MQVLSSPGVLGRRAIGTAIRYVYNAITIVCMAFVCTAVTNIAIRYIALIMHIATRYVATLYVATIYIRMSSEMFSDVFLGCFGMLSGCFGDVFWMIWEWFLDDLGVFSK